MSQILTTKIETIEDARVFYEAMGCSHFHMARESIERYNEYKMLDISLEMEQTWRRETLLLLGDTLLDQPEQIWYKHSLMLDICQMTKELKGFVLLLQHTNAILKKLPRHDYVLVAENLMGRTDRSLHQGFIYDCYAMHPKLAVAFMKVIDYLIMYGDDSVERVVNARMRYDEIQSYLHLL